MVALWLLVIAGAVVAVWLLLLSRSIRKWHEHIEAMERKTRTIEASILVNTRALANLESQLESETHDLDSLNGRLAILEGELKGLTAAPKKTIHVLDGPIETGALLWIVESVNPAGLRRQYIASARTARGAIARAHKFNNDADALYGAAPFVEWKKSMALKSRDDVAPPPVAAMPDAEPESAEPAAMAAQ